VSEPDSSQDELREAVRLRFVRVAEGMELTPDFIRSVEFQSRWMTESIQAMFSRRIPAVEGEPIFVPKTWWDHLKQTVRDSSRCPRWVRRRIWVNRMRYVPTALIPNLEIVRQRFPTQEILEGGIFYRDSGREGDL
jgi:hypothetical protein